MPEIVVILSTRIQQFKPYQERVLQKQCLQNNSVDRETDNIETVACYRDGDNELEGAGQPVMTSLVWLWDGNKWSLTG